MPSAFLGFYVYDCFKLFYINFVEAVQKATVSFFYAASLSCSEKWTTLSGIDKKPCIAIFEG